MTSPSRSTGFTLVEVVVVILIMALLAGLAVGSLLRMGNRNLDNFVERVDVWVASLADRAVLEGSVYGVRVETDRLRALVWFDERWYEVEHDALRSLPTAIEIELVVDGQVVTPPSDDELPALVLMPTGTPLAAGEMQFRSAAGAAGLRWDSTGLFEIIYGR